MYKMESHADATQADQLSSNKGLMKYFSLAVVLILCASLLLQLLSGGGGWVTPLTHHTTATHALNNNNNNNLFDHFCDLNEKVSQS